MVQNIRKSGNNQNARFYPIKDSNQPVKHHPGLIITVIILAVAFMVVFTLLLIRTPSPSANTALIHIDGMILSGSGPGYSDGNTYSDDVSDLLQEVKKNPKIKAIAFIINSPGGSAVASYDIAQDIKKARDDGFLTVALIKEQGTSGAYWIASACNHVISHPLAITGSIGVLASYLEFSGLMERYNVTYENINAGIYKDTMSPYRELTDSERTLLKQKINLIYDEFINQVAKNRNISVDQVKVLADGMFIVGSEAKVYKLVDELGNEDQLKAFVEKNINEEMNTKEYRISNSLYALYGVQQKIFYWIGQGIGSNLFAKQNIEIKT